MEKKSKKDFWNFISYQFHWKLKKIHKKIYFFFNEKKIQK